MTLSPRVNTVPGSAPRVAVAVSTSSSAARDVAVMSTGSGDPPTGVALTGGDCCEALPDASTAVT